MVHCLLTESNFIAMSSKINRWFHIYCTYCSMFRKYVTSNLEVSKSNLNCARYSSSNYLSSTRYQMMILVGVSHCQMMVAA